MGASSRLRFYRYRKLLAENAIHADIHPLLGDGYLKRLYSNRPAKMHAYCAMLKRFLQIPFMKLDLLIEYELLPFVPLETERAILRGHNYILSFDDAVWEKDRNTRFEGKFEQLAAAANGVITANDELTEHLRPYNANILKVPTAIDLERYQEHEAEKFPVFTVVWIGTPVTYTECLLPFAGILKAAADKFDFELLVIAKKDVPVIPGVNMRCVDWSEAVEIDLLKRSHIGIMPLPDNDFMRGKSAYKLIQYLGAGIPAIASPVGENKNVLIPGKTGFFASSAKEWLKALEQLYLDASLREEMSRNAAIAAQEYSMRKHAARIANFIEKCFA